MIQNSEIWAAQPLRATVETASDLVGRHAYSHSMSFWRSGGFTSPTCDGRQACL